MIRLCHYHEKNMPSIAHWSQNRQGGRQKVWKKTNPQAKPHLYYSNPTRPLDTSKRTGWDLESKSLALSLSGATVISSRWVSFLHLGFSDVRISLGQPEFSDHSGQSAMARRWALVVSWHLRGAWDQPKLNRVGHFHITTVM